MASLAGRNFAVSYDTPWAAVVNPPDDSTGAATDLGSTTVPQQAEQKKQQEEEAAREQAPEQVPSAHLPPHWEEPWGDRRTELVVIGHDMDHVAMTAALDYCVMTDTEMNAYTRLFRDATPPWEAQVGAKGQLDEAEAMLRRALPIEEGRHGSEHPETAIIMYQLASVLQEKGKFDEAVEFYHRVFSIFTKFHGPEHMSTVDTLHHLARAVKNAALYGSEPLRGPRLAEAERLFNIVLTITDKPGTQFRREYPIYARGCIGGIALLKCVHEGGSAIGNTGADVVSGRTGVENAIAQMTGLPHGDSPEVKEFVKFLREYEIVQRENTRSEGHRSDSAS